MRLPEKPVQCSTLQERTVSRATSLQIWASHTNTLSSMSGAINP